MVMKFFSADRITKTLWALMFLLVAFGLMFPITIPAPAQPAVLRIYDTIQQAPDGSFVLIDPDMAEPPFTPYTPGIVALAKHMVQKHFRIVMVAFESPVYIEQYLYYAKPVFDKAGYKYGTDYVNLGYFPGYESAMAAFGRDIPGLARADAYKTAVSQLPIMSTLKSAADFKLGFIYSILVYINEGFVRQLSYPYKLTTINVGSPGTAAYLAPYMPFPVIGTLEGIRGGAEYEVKIGQLSTGVARMAGTYFINFILFGALVIGNLLYSSKKLKERKK